MHRTAHNGGTTVATRCGSEGGSPLHTYIVHPAGPRFPMARRLNFPEPRSFLITQVGSSSHVCVYACKTTLLLVFAREGGKLVRTTSLFPGPRGATYVTMQGRR